jgi:hypothetical protein
MPWKECHIIDERLRFVGRLVDSEPASPRLATRFTTGTRRLGCTGSTIGVGAPSGKPIGCRWRLRDQDPSCCRGCSGEK